MQYLVQNDYPNSSFDLHCPVSKFFSAYAEDMTPDLTILNPDTMEPLAFFRVYGSEDNYESDKLFDAAYHLTKHSKVLSIYPYYIVFEMSSASGGEATLQFYNLNTALALCHGKKLKDVAKVSAPMEYEILKSNSLYRTIHKQIIDRNKLQRFCQILLSVIIPVCAIVLLILDGIGVYELSDLRLVVFGIVVVSILIPYIAKVNIKDFSVTFRDNKKGDSDEKKD